MNSPPTLDPKLHFEGGHPIRAIGMTLGGAWLLEARDGEAATLRPLPGGEVLLPLPPEFRPTTADANESAAAFFGPDGAWVAVALDEQPRATRISERHLIGGGFDGAKLWCLARDGTLFEGPPEADELEAISTLEFDDELENLVAATRSGNRIAVMTRTVDDGVSNLAMHSQSGNLLWEDDIAGHGLAMAFDVEGERVAVCGSEGFRGYAPAKQERLWDHEDQGGIGPLCWFASAFLGVREDRPNELQAWSRTGEALGPVKSFDSKITALGRSGLYLLVGLEKGDSFILAESEA